LFARKCGPALCCILALLVAAFSELPFAFYVLLRLVVCTVSAYYALQMFRAGQTFWIWAFGANALLFNPVLPVRMARTDWQLLDLVAALFFACWIVFAYRKKAINQCDAGPARRQRSTQQS
jgi:hypothetical protein